jgi:hypothetical protein
MHTRTIRPTLIICIHVDSFWTVYFAPGSRAFHFQLFFGVSSLRHQYHRRNFKNFPGTRTGTPTLEEPTPAAAVRLFASPFPCYFVEIHGGVVEWDSRRDDETKHSRWKFWRKCSVVRYHCLHAGPNQKRKRGRTSSHPYVHILSADKS